MSIPSHRQFENGVKSFLEKNALARKAIWKFGPLQPGLPKKIIGKPLYADIQYDEIFVWSEVEPSWDALHTVEDGIEHPDIEYSEVMLYGTGHSYIGEYIDSVKEVDSKGHVFMWHLIKVG
jgi:hypothetical protein